MFEVGINNAGFTMSRGDSVVRVGDLGTNVWRSITQAGVIIADVSVPNPNVYYEIGLADALGKPVFLFKQEDTLLPADFSGTHYYQYKLSELKNGHETLTKALKDWSAIRDHRPFGVKAIIDRQ